MRFLTRPQTAFANRYGMVNKYLGGFEWKNIVKLAKAIVTRGQQNKDRFGNISYVVVTGTLYRNSAYEVISAVVKIGLLTSGR